MNFGHQKFAPKILFKKLFWSKNDIIQKTKFKYNLVKKLKNRINYAYCMPNYARAMPNYAYQTHRCAYSAAYHHHKSP